jgi:hypothetical protein
MSQCFFASLQKRFIITKKPEMAVLVRSLSKGRSLPRQGRRLSKESALRSYRFFAVLALIAT